MTAFKTFLLTLTFLFSCLIVGLIFGLNVHAQELEEIQINNIKERLPLIIYSEDVTEKTINKDGIPEKGKNYIEYYYISDEIVKNKEIIYCDLCDYSSVEKINNKTFKIYAGTPFYRNSNGETVEIKVATTSQAMWEQANLISWTDKLLKTPYALADSYFTTGDDGLVCSPDGKIDCYSSFSTCRTSSTGKSRGASDFYVDSSYGGGLYCIDRMFLNFDTSSLEGTVASTSLFVYGFGKTGATDRTYNVFGSTASNPIDVNDFDLYGATAFATGISQADFNASGYNQFIFNSSGNSAVGETTKLSILETTSDVGNSAPTDSAYIQIRGSSYTGTSQDPYLLVDLETEEEEPIATSTPVVAPCTPITNNDLSLITGCSISNDGTATTTTSLIFHIPAIVWFVFFGIFSFIFGRLLLEFIIILRGK